MSHNRCSNHRLEFGTRSRIVSWSTLGYHADGGAWTTVSSGTATVTVSGDGNHTLDYNSTDVARNQESTNTEYVALDTTPRGDCRV